MVVVIGVSLLFLRPGRPTTMMMLRSKRKTAGIPERDEMSLSTAERLLRNAGVDVDDKNTLVRWAAVGLAHQALQELGEVLAEA